MRSCTLQYLLVLVGLSIVTAGCQAHRGGRQDDEASWQRTELLFGLARPDGGTVSDTEWDQFLANEVTPRFPAGLSVLDASGQWADPSGRLVRERSRCLVLLHEGGQVNDQKIEDIRTIYKTRFRQDSVMRIDAPARVRF